MQTRHGAFERARDGLLISDDPAILDVDAWHRFLDSSYWAAGIPLETFRRAAANSLCLGLYLTSGGGRELIGAARVITDRATFAYLADVFIDEGHRSGGLGVWLVESVLAHPDLRSLRRFCLLTRDAHGLYARFGFAPMRDPSRYMEIHDPDVYRRAAPASAPSPPRDTR